MKRKQQIAKYLVADVLASVIAYTLFFIIRQYYLDEETITSFVIKPTTSYWIGVSIVPLIWLLFFYISGYYQNAFRKHAINELGQTLSSTLLGTIALFFAIMLDDFLKDSSFYYREFFVMWGLEFSIVYLFRNIITLSFKYSVRRGKYGFKTAIVGDVEAIQSFMKDKPHLPLNAIMGAFVVGSKCNAKTLNNIPCLGNADALKEMVEQKKIEEVIVLFSSKDNAEFTPLMEMLHRYDVFIKVSENISSALIGHSRLMPVYGTTLVELQRELMPIYEANTKRVIDIVFSVGALILLLPFFTYIILRMLLTSRGPIFFKQQRLGKNRRPFTMLKFRSMHVDAEKGQAPQLSAEDDERITDFGKILRKYRFDELPQFWNVIKGDMSIVGPRPERAYFVDKIVAKEPNYLLNFKVRPGITSYGMVKYGYAKNVDEMVERFKYDFLYLENKSLMFDAKVVFYTVFTVATGKGV